MKERIIQFFIALNSILFKNSKEKDLEILALRQQLALYKLAQKKSQK